MTSEQQCTIHNALKVIRTGYNHLCEGTNDLTRLATELAILPGSEAREARHAALQLRLGASFIDQGIRDLETLNQEKAQNG